MAVPRAVSFKALRNLRPATSSVPVGARGLHITGIYGAPQRIDPAHKTTYMAWGLHDLRNECRNRTLTPSGTKYELIDRLAAHDSLQARAFSMAMRRVAKDETKKTISRPADSTPHRSFNTSRISKAVNDTSTIDFAYLPRLFEGDFVSQPSAIRVPILAHINSETAEANLDRHPDVDAAAGGYQDTDAGHVVMRPQVEQVDPSTVTNFSVMSDLHDGSPRELSVDVLSRLGDTVGGTAKEFATQLQNQDEAVVRKLWNGFLDDLFGAQAKTVKA